MPAYNKRSLRDLSLHPQDSVVGLVSLPQSLFDGVLVRHVRIRRLGGDLVPEAGLAVPTIGLKRRAQWFVYKLKPGTGLGYCDTDGARENCLYNRERLE